MSSRFLSQSQSSCLRLLSVGMKGVHPFPVSSHTANESFLEPLPLSARQPKDSFFSCGKSPFGGVQTALPLKVIGSLGSRRWLSQLSACCADMRT